MKRNVMILLAAALLFGACARTVEEPAVDKMAALTAQVASLQTQLTELTAVLATTAAVDTAAENAFLEGKLSAMFGEDPRLNAPFDPALRNAYLSGGVEGRYAWLNRNCCGECQEETIVLGGSGSPSANREGTPYPPTEAAKPTQTIINIHDSHNSYTWNLVSKGGDTLAPVDTTEETPAKPVVAPTATKKPWLVGFGMANTSPLRTPATMFSIGRADTAFLGTQWSMSAGIPQTASDNFAVVLGGSASGYAPIANSRFYVGGSADMITAIGAPTTRQTQAVYSHDETVGTLADGSRMSTIRTTVDSADYLLTMPAGHNTIGTATIDLGYKLTDKIALTGGVGVGLINGNLQIAGSASLRVRPVGTTEFQIGGRLTKGYAGFSVGAKL